MTAPDISNATPFNNGEKFDRKAELDVEDSGYLLHALEAEAFSCVVTAMRAQGMLTEYKQILLEHLKAALFVSDATFKAEIRRATSDEVLCKIAETLNPSYDTFVQWGVAANEMIPPAFNQIPLYNDEDIEGLDVAGQLLRLANSHNSSVDTYNDALHELITLPKAPFVPEKLRALLRETESAPSERMDLNMEDNCTTRPGSRNKKNPPTTERRTRRSHANQKVIKEESAAETASSDTVVKAECITFPPSDNMLTRKQKTALDCIEEKQQTQANGNNQIAKQFAECSVSGNSVEDTQVRNPDVSTCSAVFASVDASCTSHGMGAAKSTQKPEKRKMSSCKSVDEKNHPGLVEEGKQKRKKSKQRENVKDTCARVRPFLFDPGSPGQAKPPRGNPDKRSAKRSSPTFSCPTPTNGIPCTAGLSPQSYPTPVSSRGIVYTSTSPTVSRFGSSQNSFSSSGVVIKRMRTSSTGEMSSQHNGYYSRLAEAPVSAKMSGVSERPYSRSSMSSRIFIPPSQASAAYSNPTRPYYGNPSAAAMGVTVRSSPVAGTSAGMCSSSAGPSIDKLFHTQNMQVNDAQQIVGRHYTVPSPVFLTVNHQQSNKITARRSSYPSKSLNSLSSSVAVHVSPIPNGSCQGGVYPYKSSSSAEQFDSSYRSNSFSTSHSSSTSVSSLPARCIDYASPISAQNVIISQEACSLSHPDEYVHQNTYVTQGGRQTVLLEREGCTVDVIAKDDGTNSMNSDDCGSTQEMRLECDEVMAPEHRCVISPRSAGAMSPLPVQIKHVLRAGDVPPRVSQQLSVLLSYDESEPNEMQLNHAVQPQYINGLMHQDDQEIVNLITSDIR